MKIIFLSIIGILCLSACSNKQSFNQKAGNLRLVIDQTGKITALEDVAKGINYIATDTTSYLVECSKYLADSSSVFLKPQSMKIIDQPKSGTKVELSFKEGIKLTVLITPKEGYFRMELIGAEPVSEISQILWGPYKTTMRGLIGEWIGINRSNDFTLGMLSLEPNTDGILSNYSSIAAEYTKNGSLLELTAFDQTRGRFVKFRDNNREKLRSSVPIPGLTVVGSTVALYGCPTGKTNELDVIEKIELGENLPHPTFAGKWNKKYPDAAQKLAIWAYNCDKSNFGEYLKITKEMGSNILCRNTGFFKNWGHFDYDLKVCPNGIDDILADSKQARKEGIGLSLYTLTTFLKPINDREPYLAPVPDDRLITWKPEAKLGKDLSPNDNELTLQKSDEVIEALNAGDKVIRIDNELIDFKNFTVIGNEIIAKGCKRGAFYTDAVTHTKSSNVKLMCVSGFHNFYPKTIEFSNEFSDKFAEIQLDGDLDLFITDGFESCFEMGYGAYGCNVFLKNFYDKCSEKKKELLYSGSGLTNYTWHVFSHFTWGEYDQERGFRGTQLDPRIGYQIQLRNNLMPNKLGQYYPETGTAEDIEWLMGFSVGWESGVDFQLSDINKMRSNPDYDKILEIMKLWEQARSENAFTEQQKMALRQSDVQYKLSRKADADGGWDLKFVRFWHNEKVRILPPSAMAAKPVNGGAESVKPCSIDRSWTHYPGTCDEVGLSDDLVHRTGTKETSWTVDYPAYTESPKSWFPTNKRYFQFVIRLPKNAPCAVKNFKVTANGKTIELPLTLQPGQYLSVPHPVEWACVYNEQNEVVGEIFFHGSLPKVEKGSTATVSLSCEPTDARKKPEVIVNVQCKNGFIF